VIRVLVVEDSAVVRELLCGILSSDPDLLVVGTASNGAEALNAVAEQRPDVVTMDIHMPVMDGFESTRSIMETHPTPIVIVSGNTLTNELDASFRALEAGALTVLARPPGPLHRDYETASRALIRTVKLMSEVKVVRRLPRQRPAPSAPASAGAEIQAAVVGASTGGPAALREIFSALPRDLKFPVLVVQHIGGGFLTGLVDWLNRSSAFPMRLAVHGEPLLPGRAYVAPEGFHMGVTPDRRVLLSEDAPEYGARPSVSYLFRTSSEVFGSRLLAVLLTGMGKDGAKELGLIRSRGALTVAQDKATSVVFGMPGEAVRLGAAGKVLALEEIGPLMASLGAAHGGVTR